MAAVEYATQHSAGLRFTESDIERRRQVAGLEQKDLVRLAATKPIFIDRAAGYAGAFFQYLGRFKEAGRLFARPQMLQQAEVLMRDHLAAMMEGECGVRYIEQRLRLAKLFIDASLPVHVFLGAYRDLLTSIGFDIVIHFAGDPVKAFWVFNSVQKIALFDIAIIIDFLLDERERTIALRQEAIGELPVLQLHDGLLLLPIVGRVDAGRARQLTECLLNAVRSRRATVVVIDFTGAAAINAEAADRLVQAAEAARLIGVAVILSGLSAAMAQTLIDLGVELSSFDIVGDLQSGVEKSEGLLRNNRVLAEGTKA